MEQSLTIEAMRQKNEQEGFLSWRFCVSIGRVSVFIEILRDVLRPNGVVVCRGIGDPLSDRQITDITRYAEGDKCLELAKEDAATLCNTAYIMGAFNSDNPLILIEQYQESSKKELN